MRIVLVLIAFLCSISFANLYDNPIELKSISGNIPEFKSIKCKFKQEKRLQNIAKPIISGGDFEFIQNKGVYFYTKYPIESTADFTNDKYKQINDIINAISNKKYSKLNKEFEFYYSGNISQWSLGLKPKKNCRAYNYIVSISIEGKDYINKIIINQVNGNKTTIWFSK